MSKQKWRWRSIWRYRWGWAWGWGQVRLRVDWRWESRVRGKGRVKEKAKGTVRMRMKLKGKRKSKRRVPLILITLARVQSSLRSPTTAYTSRALPMISIVPWRKQENEKENAKPKSTAIFFNHNLDITNLASLFSPFPLSLVHINMPYYSRLHTSPKTTTTKNVTQTSVFSLCSICSPPVPAGGAVLVEAEAEAAACSALFLRSRRALGLTAFTIRRPPWRYSQEPRKIMAILKIM